MTRKEIYQLIKQKTGSSKLASKGRNYGATRLYQEFGIGSPRVSKKSLKSDVLDRLEMRFDDIMGKYDIDDIKARRDLWSEWSKNDEYNEIKMPLKVRRLAEAINRKFGFEKEASYGFAVTHYAFTNNESLRKYLDILKPTRQTKGEFYLST